MSGKSLQRYNFKECKLQGSNLKGSKFDYAIMTGVDMTDANLEGANLVGADLRSANLRSANLEGADLSEYTFLPDGTYANSDSPQILKSKFNINTNHGMPIFVT
jgi:uncharacterized protein YjbI with pentapeptide repeats